MVNDSTKVLSLLLTATLLLAASCSTKQTLPTQEQIEQARMQVPCIVALPVVADLKSDPSLNYQTAAELEKGASFMDVQLNDALKGHDNVRFLSERQLTSLLPESEAAQAALFRTIGSELKCNAVLVTSLSRYSQRVGGDYGVDSPASATFTMKLFNAADASVIWSSTFDVTQESLFENLMSAHKYGLKWLTVEELLIMGITEKVEQCPYF